MSSELDRMLRDGRDALPVPDESATQRARGRTVGSVRRRRTRARVLVLAGATIAAAIALGVTAGSLNAPSVTAAREPAVLGFVPEPGWFALQSPPPAIPGQQIAAVAANVAFAPDDVENGLVEPSGLPYATLLALPADGIVLVATMTPQAVPQALPATTGLPYTEVELPLQLRDAMPVLRWGAQVRPDQPLAQYHLSGSLHGHNVDVVVYFGTSQPSSKLMREAQRQLDGFVFRPGKASLRKKTAEVATPATTVAVIDRTFACNTRFLGGLYRIELRAHGGYRGDGAWLKLPFAGVFSGGSAGVLDNTVPPSSALAWVTAGLPTPQATVDDGWDAFTVATGGTLGRNAELCRPSAARVELARTGVRGGEVGKDTLTVDCDAPRRVLVRLRATARGSTALRERARIFAATNASISRAELAVRTPGGKLLAYADVHESGRARQYTAPRGCVREP